MGKFVLDTEAAFIRMLANRDLREGKEGESHGGELSPPGQTTRVVSGYRARIRHARAERGRESIAMIWPKVDGSVTLTEAAELASELLARPARIRDIVTNGWLEFVADE